MWKTVALSRTATALFLVGLVGLGGCAATVPLATAEKDQASRQQISPPGKSRIVVVRSCPYAQKLHEAAVDNGPRIALACQTFTTFNVDPGAHLISAHSTENREVLRLTTVAGQTYYVQLGWRIGSGTGDVRVTVTLLDQAAGAAAVAEAKLVSDD